MLLPLVLAVVLMPACGSSPSAQRPAPTPSNAISGALARESAKPDPNFDMGFSVQITDQGFHPYVLVAPCCKPITWTNLTQSPVSVVFTGVDSGPIPPGGKYTFKPPNVESIAYHEGQNPAVEGRIQVNQTQDS
ncbi:MAG: hypothetical protein J2P28_15420 [Actinobacteria bacterium]|nr:hypothetical protein [Actinomycetota bacterium]